MLVLAVVLLNSWVSDDAFITLRTVDRVLSAGALDWNPGDRVQVFTHPLWVAALIPAKALIGSGWWAAWALGVALTAVAAAALSLRGSIWSIVALLGLAGSRSVVDFSTAGLETPLLHLLLAALLLPRQPWRPGVVGGLALLTRLDAAPLVLPIVLGRARAGHRRGALLWTLGLPTVWMGASLVWFGALLPNPALAKLGGGVPRGEVLDQGFAWLSATATWDPVGVALLALGAGAAILRPGTRAVALGIGLHLVWVAWAGGDFMLGRFATPTIFAAAAVLATLPPSRHGEIAAACVLLAAMAASPLPPWTLPPSTPHQDAEALIDEDGIVDERMYYTPGSALWGWRPGVSLPDHRFRRRARGNGSDRPRLLTGVGMTGYFAPDRVLVDKTGVTDPFLARLPARAGARRPGHLYRDPPFGYVEWHTDIECPIQCADERLLCEDVKAAARAPLWDRDRVDSVGRLLVGDVAQVLGAARPVFLPRSGPCAE